MAMEILGPIHLDQPKSNLHVIPSPPSVPPAPPVPSNWPVQHCTYLRSVMEKPAQSAHAAKGTLGLHRDSDSGLWSSVGEDLPGCGLSDSEFNAEFSSRRGSADSADSALSIRFDAIVPTPPPVPPLPSYLQNLPQRSSSPPSIHRQSSIREAPDILPNLYRGIVFYDEFDDDISFYNDDDSSCMVCYCPAGTESWRPAMRRCCNRSVCRECMVNMVHAKIGLEGVVHMECPNPDCDAPLPKSEILDLLSGNSELKERFERMRLEAEGDGSKRPCPNCSHLTEHEVPSKRNLLEEDVKITCVQCSHEWCYNCQAPWHIGITCKQFRKGDKQFSKWTKGRSTGGVANCQKCPLCRVYIQRSTGCDHMTCNRCDTHFCYKCGGRFIDFPGLGDHYDRVGLFGCERNYLPDQPIKRKAVRGGYFGAKIAMLTGYPVLFVAGAVVVVTVGAVALPIYGGYRFYKYRKNVNRVRRRRRRH